MPCKPLPFQLDIAKPCHEQWTAMTGSASQRFCDSCQKHVHNLAAMTPTEIEREVIRTGGRLCGRITRREDGSIVTVEEHSQSPIPVAAGFVLASTLSFGSAFAQAPANAEHQAIVAGRVVTSDGSPLAEPALVTFTQKGFAVARILTEADGSWSTDLLPDRYEVKAFALAKQESLEIHDVQLHAGLQSMGTIRTKPEMVVITVGDVVTAYDRSAKLRHPIRYLTYLRNRYFRST